MKLDTNAKYQESHEWARQEGDLIVCGITDHAQDSLSDVVYVELPEVGSSFERGQIFGVVESVKAASDLYIPMSGEIVEINSALVDTPELVNSDPFGDGWMIKIKPSNPGEWDSLLSGEDYEKIAAE
ncbi:MAG: glycine cleavage system protein GcvH [Anaerolineae bacterium]|nr:glycine cleavage system protein GcvH [Anaerolineales bacterium]MCQ3975416.1 glycine cleavage system protein GcvH [Anaerolineae bacterium]